MPGTGPRQDRYLQANRPRRNENSRWRLCDRSGHYPRFRLPHVRFGYCLVALPPPHEWVEYRTTRPVCILMSSTCAFASSTPADDRRLGNKNRESMRRQIPARQDG